MVAKLSLLGKLARPFALGFKFLKSSRFWSVLVFSTVIAPAVYGGYKQLVGFGLEWYFAFPSSIAVELGGQFLTVFNGYMAFANQGITVSNSALLISSVSALFTLLWVVSFWRIFVTFFFGKDAPPIGIYLVGLVLFLSLMLITLLIDTYVLSENVTRLSGMTYWFENPEDAKSMAEFLYDQGVNSTMGNSSIGGNMSGGLR